MSQQAQTARSVSSTQKPALTLKTREALTGLLLIAPALLGLGIFVYRPLADTIGLSFTNWNMVRAEAEFLGGANYREMASSDTIRTAIGNTGIYILWLFGLIIIFPLFVGAGFTYVNKHSRRFFTAVIFSPMVISLGIASVLWLWIYNPISGLLGYAWRELGMQPVSWLSNPGTALGAIAVIVAWKAFGYNMMLFIAGMGTIPRELIDAARVDGAEGLTLWRRIILPLLAPTIVFVLFATLTMATEYVFTPIHVLTGGGPADASTNIVFEVWRQAFRWFRVGYSSAIAVTVFLAFLFITVVQMLGSERIISYEER
ncbi:MAG: sugar ABC transporter permease [Trueperaceae bacterium]